MLAPKLRFKEFNDEWNYKLFNEIFEFLQNNSFSRDMLNYSENSKIYNIHYGDILTKYGEIIDFNIISNIVPKINNGISLSKFEDKSYLKNGDIVIADTAEDLTVGKSCEVVNLHCKALAGLHTIPCRPKFKFASQYLGEYINSTSYHSQLIPYITGIKVSSISKNNIIKTKIYFPTIKEQEKIALFLNLLDKKIELQQRKIEVLKMYKKGLINEIFLDIDDYDIIGNVIEFEQPNKYIVSNANYEHKKTNDNIPVLTANKAFILGYTNEKEGIYKKGECVIFDDFTMESKYVDFEFKIKSSAIKILTAKGNNDMYYLFEAINTKKLVSNEHKRHYISIVQHLEIPVADLNTQCYISNLLRRYNKKLSVENEKLKELRILKTGLLQNMFI